MKGKYTISIAMTTYNGERFLQEQLDSFLWQTRLPDELVVCDDGSTDRTLEILEAFAKKAPFPVKIYRNPQRLGYSKNFEKAALMCSGDLIAFSDQDDVWLPEKLESAENVFLSDNNIGIFYHNAMVVDEYLRPLNFTLWDLYRKFKKNLIFDTQYHFLRDFAFNGNSLIIKKDILIYILPVPSFWSYDKWLPFVAIFYAKSYTSDKILLKYRHHAHQTAFKKKKTNIQKLKEYLTGNDNEDIYFKRLYKWKTAYQCLPDIIINSIGKDIEKKINLIKSIIKYRSLIKIFIIFKHYIQGYYHLYEHGTRSMLRDLVVRVSFEKEKL